MKYELHWLDGRTEVVEGESLADAVANAGYGAGALWSLDYYDTVEEPTLRDFYIAINKPQYYSRTVKELCSDLNISIDRLKEFAKQYEKVYGDKVNFFTYSGVAYVGTEFNRKRYDADLKLGLVPEALKGGGNKNEVQL